MVRLKVDRTCKHSKNGFTMDFPITKHCCTPPIDIFNVKFTCFVWDFINKPNKTQSTTHRGGLEGRPAWIRPRAWFVLHLVAAQLFQTIRLEPAVSDHPTCCWPCASRRHHIGDTFDGTFTKPWPLLRPPPCSQSPAAPVDCGGLLKLFVEAYLPALT